MDEMTEILSLLRENNILLKELVGFVRSYQDPANVSSDDSKDFCMNVIANIVASDLLENEKGIAETIKTKFKVK